MRREWTSAYIPLGRLSTLLGQFSMVCTDQLMWYFDEVLLLQVTRLTRRLSEATYLGGRPRQVGLTPYPLEAAIIDTNPSSGCCYSDFVGE